MKFLVRFAIFILLGAAICSRVFAAPPPAVEDAALRQKIVQTLQAEGAAQQKFLGELADSGSKLVRDVLIAWTRGEVYLYRAPDGAKVPILLEDQQDANGRARAIRIDNGQFLTDAGGQDLRLDPNNLDTVDTDMRLRSTIQQALDMLSLADPDVDARHTAVVKLGYSQKLKYVPVLQARLAKEKDASVVKAINEAIALLQLGNSDVGVQISAAQQLGRLGTIGSLDTLKKLAGDAKTNPSVVQAAKKAIQSIQNHITWVNFFGTIFHGLSLGSILLVVALGLAITFGLMGVINMAHGEM
ncbi:MAG TPA: hypothetical protein VMI53_00395, partial [Opitutaceae bacterium]|nr:hypothetical protein [Opitutaceae bacterium]